MLLGFKDRFVPYVEDGSKTHTIRAFGKRRLFRVGDSCDCYAHARQPDMRLIGRWPCVKVETIEIQPIYSMEDCPLYVLVDGVPLSPDETDGLLYRDGFREWSVGPFSHTKEAKYFWEDRIPFKGQLIHWKFTAPQLQGGAKRTKGNQ